VLNSSNEDQQVREALLIKRYVSHETLTLLDRYVALLRQWQSRTNLVAPSSLQELWSRHILDSVQLLQICPDARIWVDLGSGGGFPGLVIACAMREVAGHVHLVESNGKKASFLRHVSASLQLPCTIHAERIETVVPKLPVPDIVTARALADLDTLLSLASSLLKRGAIGLFPKGRDYAMELTKAAEHWHFSSRLHASVTDPDARVVEITHFEG
jgi:16S rRNA (guanine527-N7)-methyltransferase